MKTGKLLSMAVALILSAGIAAAAPAPAPAKSAKTSSMSKMTTHHLMGTISSVSSSDLVLSHKVKGKEVSSTFQLDSKTKKQGALDKGYEATVYYQIQKGDKKLATAVKAWPAKKKS